MLTDGAPAHRQVLGRRGGAGGCGVVVGAAVAEADEVVGTVRRRAGGVDGERDRGGVPAGVLAVVGDDVLGRVRLAALDLPLGLASLA